MKEEKKTEYEGQVNFEIDLGIVKYPLCAFFFLKCVEIIYNLIS